MGTFHGFRRRTKSSIYWSSGAWTFLLGFGSNHIRAIPVVSSPLLLNLWAKLIFWPPRAGEVEVNVLPPFILGHTGHMYCAIRLGGAFQTRTVPPARWSFEARNSAKTNGILTFAITRVCRPGVRPGGPDQKNVNGVTVNCRNLLWVCIFLQCTAQPGSTEPRASWQAREAHMCICVPSAGLPELMGWWEGVGVRGSGCVARCAGG